MTTGTYYPSAEGTNSWTSPSNARADDDSWATCAPAKNNTVAGIWTTFGITDPGSATITAVRVKILGKVSVDVNLYSIRYEYSVDGGSSWTTIEDILGYTVLTTTETEGLDTVTGDRTWTWTLLNDTNFRVRITGRRGNTNTAATISMDYVKVEVDYSIPINKTVTDTLVATDASPTLTKTCTVTDTLSLSVETVLKGAGVIKTETLSLADIELVGKSGLSIIETLSLNDIKLVNKSSIEIDTLALAEVIGITKLFVLTDVGALIDSKLVDKSLFITDVDGLADLFSTPIRSIIRDDTISHADIEFIDKGIIRTDTLSIADSFFIDKFLYITESYTLAELYATDRDLLTIETGSLEETIIVEKPTPAKDVSDTISLAELTIAEPSRADFALVGYNTVSANWLNDIFITDRVYQTDIKAVGKTLFPLDTILLNEILLSLKTLYPQDYVLLTEALLCEISKQVADVLSASDAKFVSKAIPISDVTSTSDAKFVNKTIPLADAASLIEAISLVQATKMTADALTTADVMGLPSAVKSVLDASTLSELVDVYVSGVIYVTDSVSSSEQALIDLTRIVLDDLHLLDIERQDRVMVLNDILQIAETIIKEGASERSATDVIALAEVVYIMKQLYETDGISATDALQYFIGKNIADIISTAETITRNKNLIILETITPTELFLLDKLLHIIEAVSSSEWVFGAINEVEQGYRIYGQLCRRTPLKGHLQRSAALLGTLILIEGLLGSKAEKMHILGNLHIIEELEGSPPEQSELSDYVTTHKNLLMYDVAMISSEIILIFRDRAILEIISGADVFLISKNLGALSEDIGVEDTVLTSRDLSMLDAVTILGDSIYLDANKLISDTLSLSDSVLLEVGLFTLADSVVSDEMWYKTAEIILSEDFNLADAEYSSGEKTISDGTLLDDLLVIAKDTLSIDMASLSDAISAFVGGGYSENFSLAEQFVLDKEICLFEVLGSTDIIATSGAVKEFIVTDEHLQLIFNYSGLLGSGGWRKIAQQFDTFYPLTLGGGTVMLKNENPTQVWGDIYCRIRTPGDDLENTIIAETVICRAEDVPTDWTPITFRFDESIKITGPWLFSLEFDNPSDVWYMWVQLDGTGPVGETFLIWQDYGEYWFENEDTSLTYRLALDLGLLDEILLVSRSAIVSDALALSDEFIWDTMAESRIDYAHIDYGVIAYDYGDSRIDYAMIDSGTIATSGFIDWEVLNTTSLSDSALVYKDSTALSETVAAAESVMADKVPIVSEVVAAADSVPFTYPRVGGGRVDIDTAV